MVLRNRSDVRMGTASALEQALSFSEYRTTYQFFYFRRLLSIK